MLTSDPIYYKALRPKITILNYNNSSTFYAFDPFLGTITTGPSTVFPIGCNVSLSQSGHGSFSVTIEDQNEQLNRDNITVGSRVIISCGKQSSQITKLISGVVRVPGFDRGKNNKVLYRLSGPSTGIRLNERVGYWVSEAAKLLTGQIDTNDASRKADTLLETTLTFLNSEGIITTGGTLASDSDVETFVADNSIEYGEAQDFVNYVEELSGGEVVVDVNDLIRFRNSINLNVGGRGFTIKNEPPRISLKNDDADDTMYLRGGNWQTDWDFNKDAGYGNRAIGILGSEPDPVGNPLSFGGAYSNAGNSPGVGLEYAVQFRPTHTRFLSGDLFIFGKMYRYDGAAPAVRFRVVGPDTVNSPNSLPVIANIDFPMDDFPNLQGATDAPSNSWSNNQQFYDTGNNETAQFLLDTTKNYWLILSSKDVIYSGSPPINYTRFHWAAESGVNANMASAPKFTSTNSSAGSGWSSPGTGNRPGYAFPRRRSHSFVMWDPKAMRAVAPGTDYAAAGLATDVVLTDMAANIRNRESVYSYMSQKLYDAGLPRTQFGMPIVTAPNIPILPGDPIVISDKVLGFSTSGGQVIITTCGDMNYNWEIGNYQAPTLLSINPIGVPSGYRG
jgi:hypothetical protein